MLLNSSTGTPGPITATSTYTLQGNEDELQADAGTGNTVAMNDGPLPPSPGWRTVVKILSGSVTLTPSSGTINGATSHTWSSESGATPRTGKVFLDSDGAGNWTSHSEPELPVTP